MECFSSAPSAFPRTLSRSASRVSPSKRFHDRIAFSRLQPFRYVQALRFARLPDHPYRCRLSPLGSRGFYVRAGHASLPPHASDILATCPEQLAVGDLRPTRFTLVGCLVPAQWRFCNSHWLRTRNHLAAVSPSLCSPEFAFYCSCS